METHSTDSDQKKADLSTTTQPLANVLADQDEKNRWKAKYFLKLYPELDTEENRAMIDNVKFLPEGIQIGPIVRNRHVMEPGNIKNVGKKYAASYAGEVEEQVHIMYNEHEHIHQFSRWEANNNALYQGLELPNNNDIEASLKALP